MNIAYSTFACPEWSLKQVLSHAIANRYQGVEFRCDAQHQHGVEVWTSAKERNAIRKQIEKSDLKTACVATGIQLTKEETVVRVIERVKLAAELEADGVRIFCGPLPDGVRSLDEIMGLLCDQLKQICEAAALMGTRVFLETYDTLSTGADMARVLKAVNHPVLSACYNNLHPIRAGEPLGITLTHLKGRIGFVHFHDGLKRADQVVICPMGKGEMPMEETLRSLVKIGYNGFLCGEWFYDQYGKDPKDTVELFADEMRSLTARNGLVLGRA